MTKILTAMLAVAMALAPVSVVAQGRIIGQQSYVTGSKPEAEPGKYKVVKIKKAKAAHHKRKHAHKVAKVPRGKYALVKIKKAKEKAKAVHHKPSYKLATATPHYVQPSYSRPSPHHHHWHNHHWLLPAIVGTAIGLGLFRFWH